MISALAERGMCLAAALVVAAGVTWLIAGGMLALP
jgi:hypothetical protein